MEARTLLAGEVVQLSPECGNPMLAACFMVVTEAKSFGAQGYVQVTGSGGQPGGQAYFRAKFEEMEPVGMAAWVVGDRDE